MKNSALDSSLSLTILRQDARFKILIEKHGPPDIADYFPGANTIFQALVRSIVYQQISGKAAAAIYARFIALYPRRRPTPARVLATRAAELRQCGLSLPKINYIKDAAQKFTDGTIRVRSLSRMSNEQIIGHLTQIKGIGVWTVHMLLIFTLNRPDVLPTGDLAIRKGFQVVYGLRKVPDHKTMEKLAKAWRAHASVASWYLWRVAENVV